MQPHSVVTLYGMSGACDWLQRSSMMSCSGRSTSACTGSIGPSVISPEEDVPLTELPKGLGPRIYVGGIPNALSQTMIRNHFSHYGKVVDVYFPKHPVTNQRQAFCFVTFSTRKAANVAVSQSNRKINGQLVSSIAATADRPMHHRAGQHAAPNPSIPEAFDMQSQLCHAYAKAVLGPDPAASAALQHALPGHSVWPGQASLAPATQPCLDFASASGLQALLQQHSLLQSNPPLAMLLAANSQGATAQSWWNEALGTLPIQVPSRPADHMQSAALASTMAARCPPYMHMEEAAIACHAMTASGLAPPFVAPDILLSYLNAAGVMAPSMAPETWPGVTEWLYQPSVLQQPDMPSNVHVENALADLSRSFLGSGPQRHKHLRDMRCARHSPY